MNIELNITSVNLVTSVNIKKLLKIFFVINKLMLNMSDKSFKKAFLTFKDPVSDVQPWSVGSNNNKKLKTHNFW